MASISTLLPKTKTLYSSTTPRPTRTRSAAPSRLSFSLHTKTATSQRLRISSGLIEPDGGKLVDLVVDQSKKGEKLLEAAALPRIKLTKIDMQWVDVLSQGWASPLSGFMRESEFLQTLHFNSLRLGDGSVVNMSVPIVLAIDDSQKNRIGESRKVVLVDSNDNSVAILSE